MNCRNCGAAMKLVDQRDYFVCEYCTSFAFPHESADSVDGVQSLGEETELTCPVCEDPLAIGSVEKQRVWHCEQCRGVFATNDDFAELVRLRRANWDGPDHKPKPLNKEELQRELRCPVCHQAMDVHPYFGPGNVVIDTCGHCGVIWLDHGEIGMIEKAPGRR